MGNTLLPYALLWAAGVWCLEHRPLLVIPVLALQVLFLARCFSLMHDCGHDVLFRSRRANRWVGFALGVVAGIPQLPWSRGHAFHHRHNGDWQKYRGPSALISTDAFALLSPAQQRRYRWLRHPLMLFPGGFFYLVIKPRLALLLGIRDLIPWLIASLQRDPGTDLGGALNGLLDRHPRLLGVVLVSDGDWNTGEPPSRAATMAASSTPKWRSHWLALARYSPWLKG